MTPTIWYLVAPGTLAALAVLGLAWKVWRKISGLLDELIGKPHITTNQGRQD